MRNAHDRQPFAVRRRRRIRKACKRDMGGGQFQESAESRQRHAVPGSVRVARPNRPKNRARHIGGKELQVLSARMRRSINIFY